MTATADHKGKDAARAALIAARARLDYLCTISYQKVTTILVERQRLPFVTEAEKLLTTVQKGMHVIAFTSVTSLRAAEWRE